MENNTMPCAFLALPDGTKGFSTPLIQKTIRFQSLGLTQQFFLDNGYVWRYNSTAVSYY